MDIRDGRTLKWCEAHDEPVIAYTDGSWSCRWQLVVEEHGADHCRVVAFPTPDQLRHAEAEIERLRELAVWAMKTGARLVARGRSISMYHKLRWVEFDHDGTDAGILAALEEAMGRE